MRPTLYFLLLKLCLICGLIVPIQAIHEDEQGLRDWILRFVGQVEGAALHPKLKLNNVYIRSAQGAVAALSLDSGELLWRKVFSEPRVCIGVTGGSVFVSSRSGAVHVLNAGTGAVETTFKLLLPAGADVESCKSITNSKARFAAFDGKNAHIFELDMNSDDEEVKTVGQFPIGEDVKGLRLSDAHLWVVRRLSADRYSLKGAVEITGVDAVGGIDVTSSAEAVAYSSHKVTLLRHGPQRETNGAVEQEVIDCSGCAASVMTNPAGVFQGYVIGQADPNGFMVKFPAKSIHVPLKGGTKGAPAILLAVQGDGDGAWALVRAPNDHLVVVRENGGVKWERWEGLSRLAAVVVLDSSSKEDRFGLSKEALGISTRGVVYMIPLAEMGSNMKVLVDVSKTVLEMTTAASVENIAFEKLEVSGADTATLFASFGVVKIRVILNVVTGAVVEATKHEDSLIVAPTFDVKRSLAVNGKIPHSKLHVFSLNMTTGTIKGYLASSSPSVTPLWTVQLPFPIIAVATGEDALRTSLVNNIRVFPNKSSGMEEVRRKFPTRNVLAVAYYEPVDDEMPTLVVTAVDVVTGSVLASMRHRNVEGPVHILIVEHAVLYHFMDVEKMRHSLGVWEMFETEVGPVLFKDTGATPPQVISSFFSRHKRVFSSRATWPPVVVGSVLGMHGGGVAKMSVTTSFGAIARKSLLFVFTSGRVASVGLNRLLAGGQVSLGDGAGQLTHVIIPSTAIVTHRYRAARPTLIATRPTNLESSCHVLVSGMDLFYVRTSSGKEFDLLNSDFNKTLLIALTCSFGVLSLVARYFAMRKGVRQLWR
ncbi:PQQ-like domain/Protein of unknown function (DUF1620), putative [Trypanosoma equiperdum]|uniref:ER membrane protein complex subunit 1 n=1 Tax=Trypanosoma equiperdum TaxID=5694 RepID=A0A1G4I2E9_TRYEQ|nr:PQQ-like domain/Protein of unknown function (DUF1620), putative [Trypanosoma equiperdum]